jgi:hypothetical protein
VLLNLSGVPTILSAVALGVAMLRSGFPARWAGWLSLAVAAGHVLGIVALARTGFFSPTGGSTFVGPVVILIWFVAVSILLFRLPRRASV